MAAIFARPAFPLMASKVSFWTATTSALTAAMSGCRSSHSMKGKPSCTNLSSGSQQLTNGQARGESEVWCLACRLFDANGFALVVNGLVRLRGRIDAGAVAVAHENDLESAPS